MSTITMPGTAPVATERRENAVTITLDQVEANIAEAVARQQQLEALEQTAYPLETEQPSLTLRQRWDSWWRNRRITILRRQLAAEQDRLAGLADAAIHKKHAAQLAYGVNLQRIDSWRDTEAAQAKAEISHLKAELELLEAEQCA